MRILAFDCALDARSAALFEGERLIAAQSERGAKQHAERLLVLIDALFAEAGWRRDSLELICLTRGPGSFTGLRIGLAAARGLALALRLPVLALGTLEALAAGVEAVPRPAVLALIDARRGQLYAQAFDAAGRALGAPTARPPETAVELLPGGPVALVGTGVALALPYLRGHEVAVAAAPELPEAARFGRLAAARAGEASRERPPEPLYLRAPDAVPLSARR